MNKRIKKKKRTKFGRDIIKGLKDILKGRTRKLPTEGERREDGIT